MNPIVGFFLILGLTFWVHESFAAVDQVPPLTSEQWDSGVGSSSSSPSGAAILNCLSTGGINCNLYAQSVINPGYSNDSTSYQCKIGLNGFESFCFFVSKLSSATCPVVTDVLGPYTYNTNTALCERVLPDPVCIADQTIQSGFYNVGTVDSAVLPTFACNDGCLAMASGISSVTRRGLIGGVYYYYAGPADFYTTGETCTAGPSVPQSTASVDTKGTCAPGQSFATMNGRTICIDSNTGETVSPYSASAVAAAETMNQGDLQEAIDAASAAAAANGLDSGTAAAVAAGTAAANQLPPDALLEKSFCEKNPSDPTCKKPSSFGAPSGVRPDVIQSWYVKKYPDGVGGVMIASFNDMKATPLYGFLDSFRVQVNSVPFDGCFSFNVWLVGDVPLCIPSGVLTFISIVLIITALFAARSIIFGG